MHGLSVIIKFTSKQESYVFLDHLDENEVLYASFSLGSYITSCSCVFYNFVLGILSLWKPGRLADGMASTLIIRAVLIGSLREKVVFFSSSSALSAFCFTKVAIGAPAKLEVCRVSDKRSLEAFVLKNFHLWVSFAPPITSLCSMSKISSQYTFERLIKHHMFWYGTRFSECFQASFKPK